MASEATGSAYSTRIVECSSFPVENSQYRVDAVRYQPTDRPIEDRWSFHFDKAASRLILGVYDGHGGSETAELISTALPESLLEHPPSMHAEIFERVDADMIKIFTKDHLLFHPKSDQWMDNAKAVKAGCMALICDIDLESRVATVANAGDCRLVAFHREGESFAVSFKTTDLNAKAPSEQDRLKAEHPAEDMIIVAGRLFGRLMSTRGFGDAYYKLPGNGPIKKYMHKKYVDAMSAVEGPGKIPINQQYESYFYAYRSPPYITARPEAHSFTIEDGDVIVMASDGLWDKISSSDVAKVIASLGRAENLALYLLLSVIEEHPPGDDTTIAILYSTGLTEGGDT